jgi:hypothetical protein
LVDKRNETHTHRDSRAPPIRFFSLPCFSPFSRPFFFSIKIILLFCPGTRANTLDVERILWAPQFPLCGRQRFPPPPPPLLHNPAPVFFSLARAALRSQHPAAGCFLSPASAATIHSCCAFVLSTTLYSSVSCESCWGGRKERKRAPFSKKGFEFTKSQKGKVDGFPLRFTLEQTEGDRRIKPAVADQSSGPAAQIHHRGSTHTRVECFKKQTRL